MSQVGLRDRLKGLDGQSYGAYKSLRGHYVFPEFELHIDFVQGDPFAAPSQLRVIIPASVAQFPLDLWQTTSHRIALEDFLNRQFFQNARGLSTSRGSGKSGLIVILQPSQAILERTAIQVSGGSVEVRFGVGLPAFGRRIAGHQAAALLCEDLPTLVAALLYKNLDPAALAKHCHCAVQADYLRSQLRDRGLVAFVANGALLPRRSGVDDRPLEGGLPFQSPPSLQVTLSLPDGTAVAGMGLPQGITLIVGGGYHGKSTLLRALVTGIYNHIPGDGREQVVTDVQSIKIRAEDGRSVTGVDLSPFINHLPYGQSTQFFSTTNASGSTSQAASILEAVEAGATVLLMDEDTSATNFMIRDRRMQALIAKAQEPITPFVDKVRQLYQDHHISTVLVMGGSGDYLDVADTVIALDTYQVADVTWQAQEIAATYRTNRVAEGGDRFGNLIPRRILPESIDPRKGRKAVSIQVRGTDEISMGIEKIDLSAIEQLVEAGQLRAIAGAMLYAQRHYLGEARSLRAVLEAVMLDVAANGWDCLCEQRSGDFVTFRALDLATAFNRLRSLKVRSFPQT